MTTETLSPIALVESALVESAWRRPDTVVVDTPTWFQTTTPSSAFASVNSVLRCVLEAVDADRIIDETIRAYRERQRRFRWLVGPSSRPLDLADRLAGKGLVATQKFFGLVADASDVADRLGDAGSEVAVEPVAHDTVEAWVDASMAGYGVPPEERAGLVADVGRLVEHEARTIRYVLARVDGVAAGTGAVRYCTHGAYFVGTSVVPRFRGRGVYKALVAHRARLAIEAGRSRILTVAVADTSAPILLRVGWQKAGRLVMFQDADAVA